MPSVIGGVFVLLGGALSWFLGRRKSASEVVRHELAQDLALLREARELDSELGSSGAVTAELAADVARRLRVLPEIGRTTVEAESFRFARWLFAITSLSILVSGLGGWGAPPRGAAAIAVVVVAAAWSAFGLVSLVLTGRGAARARWEQDRKVRGEFLGLDIRGGVIGDAAGIALSASLAGAVVLVPLARLGWVDVLTAASVTAGCGLLFFVLHVVLSAGVQQRWITTRLRTRLEEIRNQKAALLREREELTAIGIEIERVAADKERLVRDVDSGLGPDEALARMRELEDHTTRLGERVGKLHGQLDEPTEGDAVRGPVGDDP